MSLSRRRMMYGLVGMAGMTHNLTALHAHHHTPRFGKRAVCIFVQDMCGELPWGQSMFWPLPFLFPPGLPCKNPSELITEVWGHLRKLLICSKYLHEENENGTCNGFFFVRS